MSGLTSKANLTVLTGVGNLPPPNQSTGVSILPNILEMEGITKAFGDFKANDDVHLEVRAGEIHALLGENGAGKSTLMNILYGLYQPTAGTIRLQGKEVVIDSPLTAIQLGIGMVHQHFMLIPAFTVAENVILGLPSEKEPFLDLEGAKVKIRALAEKHDLQVDPEMKVANLSVGLQQQVEILKALYRGADLLILDEPTSVLTPQETRKLFETLRHLAQHGHSIIFISHKLDEVLSISDRISVLRRGKKVATVETAEVDKRELARLLVGREVVFSLEKEPVKPGKDMLFIKGLRVKGKRLASTLKGISFSAREGEIIGIAGVDGNGQTELIEAIAGLQKVESGQIIIDGTDVTGWKPQEIMSLGVNLIPEDRKEVGSIKDFDLTDNAILRRHHKKPFQNRMFIDYPVARKYVDNLIDEYDIRTGSRNVRACQLSGGNLQKLILGREIDANPKVLLAMHPTRGLDIGATEFIHNRLLEQRKKGTTIIVVSTELEEIMSLSDRIVVMYDGTITAILDESEASMELLGKHMLGEKQIQREEMCV